MSNLPVPGGPRAPINAKWFVTTAPFAAIIALYRLIPAEKRKNWNDGVSTSHEAMSAVLAPGGGWKAFAHYATPQLKRKRRHSFMTAWWLFLMIPASRIDKGQSWAN